MSGYVSLHFYRGFFLTAPKALIPGATDRRPLTRLTIVVLVRSTHSCLKASVTGTRHRSLCVAAPASVVSPLRLWQIERCVYFTHDRRYWIFTPHPRSHWLKPKDLRVPCAIRRLGQLACRSSSNARSGSIFTNTTKAGPSVTIRPAEIAPV